MAAHDPAPVEIPDAPGAAPWWLQPLYVFGIPAGIAVFLVYFLTSVVVSGQNKLQETLDLHQADQARQLLLLRLICQNTAQSERERYQCEAVTR